MDLEGMCPWEMVNTPLSAEESGHPTPKPEHTKRTGRAKLEGQRVKQGLSLYVQLCKPHSTHVYMLNLGGY